MYHRLGGRWSHVGALIFMLQEFKRCNTTASASSTSKLCRWSEPQSRNITPCQLSDIPFEQTHLSKGTTDIIITGVIRITTVTYLGCGCQEPKVNNMAQSLDEFKLWNVCLLRNYCKERGLLVSTKRKDELVALAFTASQMNLPAVKSKDAEKASACVDYQNLLTLQDGTTIPDPLPLSDGWIAEKEGIHLWPRCMILNVSDYLLQRHDRAVCERLRIAQ